MKTLPLGLLLAICAFGQKIDVEFDPSVDFSKYKTFDIRDGQLHSKNPTLNNELVKQRIAAYILSNLSVKGLSVVLSTKPDLNIHYTLGSARKKEVETYPAGWRGWRTRRVAYSEGTLVIDLRDTSTHALVWRAVAVEHQSDPNKLERKIEDMVKKSFEKYPPKKK